MTGTPTVRAVLDATAMLSYARGHIHVGEILSDVLTEDGVHVALPAVALLDAHARTGGDEQSRARLDILAALPGVLTRTLGRVEAAEAAAAVTAANGDLSRAHAAWLAVLHDAYYLTTEPERAPLILDPEQVHPIPDGDA